MILLVLLNFKVRGGGEGGGSLVTCYSGMKLDLLKKYWQVVNRVGKGV